MKKTNGCDYESLTKYFPALARCIIKHKARKATKYLSNDLRIVATRRTYKRACHKRGPVEILFTIGKPNYLDRKFLKECKRLRLPFPAKDVYMKF